LVNGGGSIPAMATRKKTAAGAGKKAAEKPFLERRKF
jgi:hypothetical protein